MADINMADTDIGELELSGIEKESPSNCLNAMINTHLLIVIQTENPPLTKYYVNVESVKVDDEDRT